MRKYFWQSEGRLKTGRISLIFFLCLLLGLGLLFKLQQPVDKAIVVVRHVFAAPSKSKSETKFEKSKTVAKAKFKSPVKPKETAPKPRPKPVQVARVEPAGKPVTAAPEITAKAGKAPVVKKVTRAALVKRPAPKMEKVETAKSPVAMPAEVNPRSPVTPKKDLVQDSKVVPPAVSKPKSESESVVDAAVVSKPQSVASAVNMLTEELIVAPPLLQPSSLQSSKSQPPKSLSDKPDSQTAVTLMTKAQRQLLRPKPAAAQSRKKDAPSVKFAAIKPLKHKKTSPKAQIKPEESNLKSMSEKLSAKPKVVKESQTSGITVAKKEYKKLHHAWQAAGQSRKGSDQVIPLQIENLRAAYDLLQMKAVVIRPDESCIDLADGSRIPPAALDRFSSTVLQVDDPWQKWGTQLKAAGLRPGQPFKVRYYLYDFVRRSIYARVNQAYRWSLAKGLIQAETKPDEVDVLGRTYVIKRSGGGAFGVFVPLSLKTSAGRRVAIDPLCFGNAQDINALRSAGII